MFPVLDELFKFACLRRPASSQAGQVSIARLPAPASLLHPASRASIFRGPSAGTRAPFQIFQVAISAADVFPFLHDIVARSEPWTVFAAARLETDAAWSVDYR